MYTILLGHGTTRASTKLANTTLVANADFTTLLERGALSITALVHYPIGRRLGIEGRRLVLQVNFRVTLEAHCHLVTTADLADVKRTDVAPCVHVLALP